jgi:hypothetical protein
MMRPHLQPLTEPGFEQFFATRDGVCVYINVRGSALRVVFADANAPPSVHGPSATGGAEALGIANRAFAVHKQSLAPLFEQVDAEAHACGKASR